MNFFDGLLEEARAIIAPLPQREYPLGTPWEDVGRNTLVLKRDEAFELDGIGFNLVTSAPVGESGITVCGEELSRLSGNSRFARVSVLQLKEIDDEQTAYDTIRKVEYLKYHYFPKGFMVRTVSTSHKENVRVTKEALKDGISFASVGSLLLSKYLENPAVLAARVYYITAPSADFAKLEALAERNYGITETLNHIMKNIPLDCSACNLKPVCDEVEGMRELHFKQNGM